MSDNSNTEHMGPVIEPSGYGPCMVCGGYSDLRNGVCYGCSNRVRSEKVPGGLRLWDDLDPNNTWFLV